MEFIDLKSQQRRIKTDLDSRLATVLDHGRYIMGPEVRALETELSAFCNAEYSLSCANGTDALILSLKALGIGHGDAVFCPSFTYCATAESIAIVGAHPVFIDIDPNTYNMCAKSLERTIAQVKKAGVYAPKAVITVDLFGQSADYPTLMPIAKAHNLKVISDAAQGFGTTLNSNHPIHWADVMTTSFFPAKPLGCYGDGGAIMTNDSDLAKAIDSLRIHGKGIDKYDNVRIGLNSRLDTMQAAILLSKMNVFADEIDARNKVATRYIDNLKRQDITTPIIKEGIVSTWAQFTIELNTPDALAAHLKENGIPTARYYPIPTHLQSAYNEFTCDTEGLTSTEACMTRVISLPMHPYLTSDDQDIIIDKVMSFLP